ncbi:MAG: hypothetical protein R3A79_22315 [Nannocystaceae bacterium]
MTTRRAHVLLFSLCAALVAGVAACDAPAIGERAPVDDAITPRDFELCGDTCDPLVQGCDAGESCQYAGTKWVCTGAGAGQAGDACESAFDCAAGTVCVSGAWVAGCDASRCCTAVCPVGAPGAACGGASLCVDVFAGDADEIGACVTPALPEVATVACGDEDENEVDLGS